LGNGTGSDRHPDRGVLPQAQDLPLQFCELLLGLGRGPALRCLLLGYARRVDRGGGACLPGVGRALTAQRVCDHRDAPLCVLDEQGEPRWQAHIDNWGALAAKGELGLCPWRFAGQYEIGLYYNRFRYYESHAASYIKQDPKGLAGGIRQ
jgi:RHS repeat-associated protein